MSKNPKTGFDCDCSTRLDCYDGLICHWDFGAAFAKALRHWDWRVFVIAAWFLDECEGWATGNTVWGDAMDNGGWRVAVAVRITQLTRLDFRW